MEWQTRVTQLLGIRYPIIEGAMGIIGTTDLALAISDAGGLGMITASALRTPERLRREIRRAKSMTDKPFAVNFSPAMNPVLSAMLEVAIEEKVPVIETAGYRAVDQGKRVKEAGLIWIHKVTTVRHAMAAERDGADAVCISCFEGVVLKHPTTLTTLVTIPLAVKYVRVPIIAAGGIGDARTFLAALALGAEAVMMGTVIMALKECPLSDRRKQALVKADPYDPEWRDEIYTTPKLEDFDKLVKEGHSASLGAVLQAAAKVEGRMQGTSGTSHYPASSAVGFIERVVTAKELIDSIIKGAEEILTEMAKRL